MRIARIRHAGPDGVAPRIVAAAEAEPGRWVDVRRYERLRLERAGATAAAARRLAEALCPGSLTAALEGGEVFLEAVRAAVADPSGDALAPADAPPAVPVDAPAYRDFMAFEQHFATAASKRGREPAPVLYELPVSYMGSVQALLGPEDEVPWPYYTRHMDYELELGIVIGRGGRDICVEDAADHVLGFTVFNDFSARDMQMREMSGNLGPSKGKHFASAVGPCIVTLDELAGRPLAMSARVNGETWSSGSTGTLLWSIEELVAWAAAGETLAPGTLLGSGTVGGGCGFELDRQLQPGDVVELEIEGIGVLRNRLGSPPDRGWTPARREPSRAVSPR